MRCRKLQEGEESQASKSRETRGARLRHPEAEFFSRLWSRALSGRRTSFYAPNARSFV